MLRCDCVGEGGSDGVGVHVAALIDSITVCTCESVCVWGVGVIAGSVWV